MKDREKQTETEIDIWRNTDRQILTVSGQRGTQKETQRETQRDRDIQK